MIIDDYIKNGVAQVSNQDKRGLLQATAISTGILYEKERLEAGKSTSNIAYADALKELKAAKDELKALISQETVNTSTSPS